jgi:hypothetical protein
MPCCRGSGHMTGIVPEVASSLSIDVGQTHTSSSGWSVSLTLSLQAVDAAVRNMLGLSEPLLLSASNFPCPTAGMVSSVKVMTKSSRRRPPLLTTNVFFMNLRMHKKCGSHVRLVHVAHGHLDRNGRIAYTHIVIMTYAKGFATSSMQIDGEVVENNLLMTPERSVRYR